MGNTFSGKEVLRILEKDFGFSAKRQRGSHVTLRGSGERRSRVTVVPLHKELATGTLRGVLRLAGIPLKAFLEQSSK